MLPVTTYNLELEVLGQKQGIEMSLQLFADGNLINSYAIDSDGENRSISELIEYSGNFPESLEFRFSDVEYQEQYIIVQSVKINNKYVYTNNYLEVAYLAAMSPSATVDLTASRFLFEEDVPSAAIFSENATQTFDINDSLHRERMLESDQVFDMLAGRDVAYLGFGNDAVSGGAGNDILRGGGGNDEVFGDAGDDRLYGEDGDDILYGGDGNDRVSGNAGNDEIYGGDGDDKLHGHEGDDVIVGGLGNDTITGGNGNDSLFGDGGNDTILGGIGNDSIDGGDGLDHLYGADGNDVINGGLGHDYIKGGLGNDYISGDDGNDNLYGDDGMDYLLGGRGNDALRGGNGNDYLDGGDGIDHLFGGSGSDTFVFNNPHAFNNVDRIIDFSLVEGDSIDLRELLLNYEHGFDDITDFVQILDNGDNSEVFVDVNGTGTFTSDTQVVTLAGVTGLTNELALETSSNLLTYYTEIEFV